MLASADSASPVSPDSKPALQSMLLPWNSLTMSASREYQSALM
jgi:hypothetical protein